MRVGCKSGHSNNSTSNIYVPSLCSLLNSALMLAPVFNCHFIQTRETKRIFYCLCCRTVKLDADYNQIRCHKTYNRTTKTIHLINVNECVFSTIESCGLLTAQRS